MRHLIDLYLRAQGIATNTLFCTFALKRAFRCSSKLRQRIENIGQEYVAHAALVISCSQYMLQNV